MVSESFNVVIQRRSFNVGHSTWVIQPESRQDPVRTTGSNNSESCKYVVQIWGPVKSTHIVLTIRSTALGPRRRLCAYREMGLCLGSKVVENFFIDQQRFRVQGLRFVLREG